jgi:cell division initiation protein
MKLSAEQAKDNSRRDAETIIRDAQETSNTMIKKAEERIMEVNREYEILKQEFNMFKSRFAGMLEAQLESIERAGRDLEEKR